MRALQRIFVAMGLVALGACGQNPLLRSVSSDFAPIRVGSQWSYVDPSGAAALSRQVSDAAQAYGRDAFTVLVQVGSAPVSTQYWSFNGASLDGYDPALGWTLLRRLPYVLGNKWDLVTGDALITSSMSVDGIETVTTPAGKFDACYRLKIATSTYDPPSGLTSTAGSMIWAAPDVGDVKVADVDSAGNVNVTLLLSSYRIPR